MSNIDAPVVDYLAIQPARLDDLPGNPVVGLLTFRMTPAESLGVTNFAMTKEQLIRLRDDIDSLLHEPESWLHTPVQEIESVSRLSPRFYLEDTK